MGKGQQARAQGTGLAHLHIGRVEVPERGEGGRQPFRAVPDPQGLEMARGDPRLLTEALEGIGDKRPQRLLPHLQRWAEAGGTPRVRVQADTLSCGKNAGTCEPSLLKTKGRAPSLPLRSACRPGERDGR